MDSSAFSSKSHVVTGSNYGVWAVKMATYLKAFDLWEIVESNKQPTPLNNNPTIAQLKFFNEEKAKGFKALTCIHNGVSEEIFTRIMACETGKEAWDKLKAEFQDDEKSKRMQILNLKRQFEGLKMRETETIKEFSSNISKLVNQMRLLGEDVQDPRVVEKVLVNLPERFENKICSLEDSKDFTEMSLQDLINVLQAVEQRQAFRQESSSEEAFVAGFKGRTRVHNRSQNSYKDSQEGRRDTGKIWQTKNWQNNHSSANNFNSRGKDKKDH